MDDVKLQELLPAELRDYMTASNERDYVLVDVRQPAEYAAVHIPGAVLMPLMDLEAHLFDLPQDRELVFYCRTGARSQVAAMLANEAEVSDKRIYNLIGGILAWKGRKLSDFPRIQVFQKGDDALLTAMNLEKGAWRFYRHILQTYEQKAFASAIQKLSQAEENHARMIYAFWKRHQFEPPAFENLFQELDGEIIEGGEPLQEALARMEAATTDPCLDILELSLEIEYRAYDLYRNMAAQDTDTDRQQRFLTIAQAEKKHMHILSQALTNCR